MPERRVTAKISLMLDPVPPRFNLARYCLAENARLRPDVTALTVVGDAGAQRWTHAELDLESARVSPRVCGPSALHRARGS